MSWSGGNSPRVIQAFTAPVSVSTEQLLYALTDLGPSYKRLTFVVRNHDAVLKAAIYVDTSESGIVTGLRVFQVAAPLSETKVEVDKIMQRYFSLSASGDPDAGYVAVNVSFQILGLSRYPFMK